MLNFTNWKLFLIQVSLVTAQSFHFWWHRISSNKGLVESLPLASSKTIYLRFASPTHFVCSVFNGQWREMEIRWVGWLALGELEATVVLISSHITSGISQIHWWMPLSNHLIIYFNAMNLFGSLVLFFQPPPGILCRYLWIPG